VIRPRLSASVAKDERPESEPAETTSDGGDGGGDQDTPFIEPTVKEVFSDDNDKPRPRT
jgi:hypothetical protein